MSMTLGSMNTQYSPAPLPSCVLSAPAEGCVEKKNHLTNRLVNVLPSRELHKLFCSTLFLLRMHNHAQLHATNPKSVTLF